jgi:HD-GYP domain-containing protein (c-di-GMP phosphodiesterase class II)/PAS domain-containing protein
MPDKNTYNEDKDIKLLESIYNNLEQGICHHEMIYKENKAIDYLIIDANPAYEKILGIPVEKAKGSLASEIYGSKQLPYLNIYSRVAESGKTITFEEYFPPLDKYFHIKVISNEKGKFTTIFNDQSVLKKREKKLKESNDLLDGIFASIQDGISVLNKDLSIRYVNDIINEWHAEDIPVEGKKCYEVYHHRNKPCENCPTLRSFKSKKMENAVLKLSTQDRWIELYSYPMMDKKSEEVTGVVEFVRDISEQRQRLEELKNNKEELSAANEQLTAYNEEITALNKEMENSLEKLNQLNDRFLKMINVVCNLNKSSIYDEESFLSELLFAAIKVVPEADYGKICLIDENNDCKFINAIGHNIEILRKIRINKELFFCYNKKGVYTSREYALDFNKMPDNVKNNFISALKEVSRSIYINISIDNEIVGKIALDIKKGSHKSFSFTTKKILESFASLASSYFQYQRYNRLQKEFTKELILSINYIMETYDRYTSGHSENVAIVASKIAEKMGLSEEEINNTYWAGMAHDIGKLLVSIDILNKKTSLTDKEYELIKKHPIWGYKALSKSDSLKHIAKYVLYHHERWDGRGYPEGIKGDNIPLISRILAVADAWDAMTSKRAYRAPFSREEALKEIMDNRGKQFSPNVVDIFLDIQGIK